MMEESQKSVDKPSIKEEDVLRAMEMAVSNHGSQWGEWWTYLIVFLAGWFLHTVFFYIL